MPVLFGFESKHDFHTSLSEFRYNKSHDSFEVTVRVFSDDLQKILDLSGEKVKLESPNSDEVLSKYFVKKLAFVKDQKVVLANYIGKEPEPDATWIYLEFEKASSLKEYNLLNTIFFDLFDDQNNVVNYIKGDQRVTQLFNTKEKLHPFPF